MSLKSKLRQNLKLQVLNFIYISLHTLSCHCIFHVVFHALLAAVHRGGGGGGVAKILPTVNLKP